MFCEIRPRCHVIARHDRLTGSVTIRLTSASRTLDFTLDVHMKTAQVVLPTLPKILVQFGGNAVQLADFSNSASADANLDISFSIQSLSWFKMRDPVTNAELESLTGTTGVVVVVVAVLFVFFTWFRTGPTLAPGETFQLKVAVDGNEPGLHQVSLTVTTNDVRPSYDSVTM